MAEEKTTDPSIVLAKILACSNRKPMEKRSNPELCSQMFTAFQTINPARTSHKKTGTAFFCVGLFFGFCVCIGSFILILPVSKANLRINESDG